MNKQKEKKVFDLIKYLNTGFDNYLFDVPKYLNDLTDGFHLYASLINEGEFAVYIMQSIDNGNITDIFIGCMKGFSEVDYLYDDLNDFIGNDINVSIKNMD